MNTLKPLFNARLLIFLGSLCLLVGLGLAGILTLPCKGGSTVTARDASTAARLSRHRFPKLANIYQISDPYGLPGGEAQILFDRLHLWDLGIVDSEAVRRFTAYLGPDGKWRRRNPDIVTLAHFSAGDVPTDWSNQSTTTLFQEYVAQLRPEWLMRDAHGRPIRIFEPRPGVWHHAQNPTTGLQEFLPGFVNENIIATGMVDGVFFDWATSSVAWLKNQYGNQAIAINGDGHPLSDLATDAAWIQGYKKMLENSRELFPQGTILVGNGGWNSGRPYVRNLNGIMIEQFLGAEKVDQSKFGWSAIMRNYAEFMQTSAEPRVSIVMGSSDSQRDFGAMRFALASTLMFDGYFSFTNEQSASNGHRPYASAWWFDEYAVNLETGQSEQGSSTKGYLGKPISEAVDFNDAKKTLFNALMDEGTPDVDAVTNGRTWWRSFEHGSALVNPGQRAVHLKLPQPMKKIKGVADPTLNDGSLVDELWLDARSGVILLNP